MGQRTTAPAPYLDATQSIETRASGLLARMTLEEKLAQIGGVWPNSLLEPDGTLAESRAPFDRLALKP